MEQWTVGQLKNSLAGVPDETPVLYQRIEDVYFMRHGWCVAPLQYENGESQYIPASHSRYIEAASKFVIDAHY